MGRIEGRQATFMDYEGFVEKFKPKKTTDDCYTPQPIYDELLEWMRAEIGVPEAVLRPFRPGGDYKSEDYPEGCAVIDNPPFSILAEIVKTYDRAGVKYWLFAPTLTLFNYAAYGTVTCVATGFDCVYANGAAVNTSFLTNMWPGSPAAVCAGSLTKRLQAKMDELSGKEKASHQKLDYPPSVVSAARLQKVAQWGVDMVFPRGECGFVRRLDCGQQVFGGGLLLNHRLTAERERAEALAREIAFKESEVPPEGKKITLSEREERMRLLMAPENAKQKGETE